MIDIVYIELIKLKRSKVLWLVPIGALLPAILGFVWATRVMSNSNLTVMTLTVWDGLFNNQQMLMSLLMTPTLFSLLMGFLISREYQENTINQLFTYPIARFKFLLGKLFVMFLIVATVGILSFLSAWGLGLLIQHEPINLSFVVHYLTLTVVVILGGFALTPVAAVAGMIGKSIIAPMVLGIAAVVSNIMVINSDYLDKFPWSIPFFLAAKLQGRAPEGNFNLGVAVLIMTFVLPLIFALFYYARSDVHSGS